MLRLLSIFCLFIAFQANAQQSRPTPRTTQPVEIIRDQWGINHIYAKNEHDLFFAQGYAAAQDRLFQLEIWRRQATGTVAELLGPQEVKRDIGTRLFKFRGDLNLELKHYHPHGPQIVQAFVDGINAYITDILKTPEKLPFEFRVLDTKPGLWTPDVVISRHQGLLGNVREELDYGRLVQLLGPDKVRELEWFHPKTKDTEPDLTLKVDGEALFLPILGIYEAFRLPIKYPGGNVGPDKVGQTTKSVNEFFDVEKQYVGSNNWAIAGSKAASNYPMLANDPHRAVTTPSLRYWVHLDAPGWHVIGAGEPTLPGISIGHNDYGAWGLTVFETDNEDLLVYDVNPKNRNQYKFQGKFVSMKTRTETIPVKDGKPVTARLQYTRHGPVVFVDSIRNKAYAVRAGWMDRGCAPYLASLRMNQAKNWTEFRQACAYSRLPGENMVWSDKTGTIGWQAVGLSPIRKNFSGLVPVPGDGRFEWSGYLPIQQLPHSLNPKEGFIATANNNLTPANFPHRDAIGWTWAGPSRAQRIEEVLTNGTRKNLVDFMALQADYLSIPARTLVPLLQNLASTDIKTEQALSYLRKWDFQLRPESVAASIYVAWEGQLKAEAADRAIPEVARPYLRSLSSKRVIDWLVTPGPPLFSGNTVAARDSMLLTCLDRAVAELTERLGDNPDDWSYGQRKNKHITIKHPLSSVVDKATQQRIDLGPAIRGGYGETVNSTTNNLNQTHRRNVPHSGRYRRLGQDPRH